MKKIEEALVNKILIVTIRIQQGFRVIRKFVITTQFYLVNLTKSFNLEDIAKYPDVLKEKLNFLDEEISFPGRKSVIARSFLPYGDFDYETGF